MREHRGPTTNEPAVSTHDGAHAPYIFFEAAPTFGHYQGMVRVTLSASRTLPKRGGGVETDFVVTGYLRCTIGSARELIAALEKAILLAAPPEGPSQ